MNMFKKIKLQKKFIAFFTVVPLLLLSSLIKVPCPIDGGTGIISSNGMKWVSITNIEATATGVYLAFCGVYRIYPTDVTLTLQNNGDTDASGQLSLILVDYKTGKVLNNQYVGVSVPAHMQTNAIYNVYFQTNVDDPTTVKVNAKVVGGDIEDTVCNGTGKVPLNFWPFYNQMKTTLLANQQQTVSTPAFIPYFLPPEDWDVPNAYEMEVYDEFAQ